MSGHEAWGTQSELAYIATIGQTSEHTRGMPRRELLQRYFLAMKKRANWDGLDRTTVLYAIYAALRGAADAP
jgi:hypothetical protein